MFRAILTSLFVLGFLSPIQAQNQKIQDVSTDYQPKDYSKLLGMPGFSNEQLNMHFKLYQGYVNNTNLLGQNLKQLSKEGKDRTPEFAGLKRMYGWEFDGMRLHELYFDNLGGKTTLPQNSKLSLRMTKDFGSYENWKKDFIATGMIRGIGWVVLYEDRLTGKLTNAWINEHDLGHLVGNKPLLVMDVFEHAYITQYGLDRQKYITSFFNNINWDLVQKRAES